MTGKSTSFFQNPFRYQVQSEDVAHVQSILQSLEEITLQSPSSRVSNAHRDGKFLGELNRYLADTYKLYWMTECKSPIYRMVREKRSIWHCGHLENGPKVAEERMALSFWGELGPLEERDARKLAVIKDELEKNLLAPLQVALNKGVRKGSRLDYLLDGLRRGVAAGSIPTTIPDVREPGMKVSTTAASM